jgi:hypothetical protein
MAGPGVVAHPAPANAALAGLGRRSVCAFGFALAHLDSRRPDDVATVGAVACQADNPGRARPRGNSSPAWWRSKTRGLISFATIFRVRKANANLSCYGFFRVTVVNQIHFSFLPSGFAGRRRARSGSTCRLR